jgi:hypothetical protein
MNNEERQRQMDFIVAQQAQFAVDIQKLQETQTELTLKHNHLTEALTAVVGMVGKIGAAQELTDARLAESRQRTDERLAELAVRHAETDDRLNVFVTVVERFISRNGETRRVKKKIAPAKGKTKPPRKK